MTAYFDNAATTHLCAAAALAYDEANEKYGNPSSLHTLGFEADMLISSSRKKIASTLGIKDAAAKLIFTGSGTEANNIAIFGTAYAKKSNEGKRIIISDSEHPSVYESALELKRRGYDLVTVGTKGGVIDPDELLSYMDGSVFLISIMTANNESGALYDIPLLCALAKRKDPRVIFHTDATQAYMKTPLSAEAYGVDLMTVSAHKIGGPKGVGALYVSDKIFRSKSISPYIFGGGQQLGLRSGTENTSGIASFAAAAEYRYKNTADEFEKTRELSEYISSALKDCGVRINEPRGKRLYNIISATLPGIKSETMLHFLSREGVFISSGSACSSHHPGISRPMKAFGLTDDEADCTVRISLSPENTREEAELLIGSMKNGLEKLVKIRKVKIN